MLLALSVVSEHGAALGAASYKVFDERGGSIGRIAGNDWVLPDAQNFVSSRHAKVSSNDGVFYLEDTSSNGTFINAPDQLASRPDPQKLSDGDRLFIGDYEIIVQLIPNDPLAALGSSRAPISEPSPLDSSGIDIATHQIAMRAAMRTGFASMLARFHPQQLEDLYERKLKRTTMLGLSSNKAKYWELFRAHFEEIERDREAQFQQLFAEDFTRAYNEHLQKLAADARLRKPR